MSFKDKYQTKEEANPKKKTISEDAYAIGEMIEELITEIRRNG